MALTPDEKRGILELCGKGYSYRKIYEKTKHSETTITKVIREAEGQVVRLRVEGLGAEQIASQLEYPLAFVSNVVDEQDTMLHKTRKVLAEPSEVLVKPDIKIAWSEFKRLQELQKAKKGLRQQATKLEDDLEQLETQLDSVGIADTAWRERKELLVEQLLEFIPQQIEGIDSEESLHNIESVVEEIKERIHALVEEYKPKLKEARELRSQQQKEHSDELLDQHISIPLFPGYVKKDIKRRFVITTEEEALIIADAMHQWALLPIKYRRDEPEYQRRLWRTFVACVKEEGWDYLQRLADQYRKDFSAAMLEIDVCPHCQKKLIRQLANEREILFCISCGGSYPIPKTTAA